MPRHNPRINPPKGYAVEATRMYGGALRHFAVLRGRVTDDGILRATELPYIGPLRKSENSAAADAAKHAEQ